VVSSSYSPTSRTEPITSSPSDHLAPAVAGALMFTPLYSPPRLSSAAGRHHPRGIRAVVRRGHRWRTRPPRPDRLRGLDPLDHCRTLTNHWPRPALEPSGTPTKPRQLLDTQSAADKVPEGTIGRRDVDPGHHDAAAGQLPTASAEHNRARHQRGSPGLPPNAAKVGPEVRSRAPRRSTWSPGFSGLDYG
jgi:hypothetical protein